MIVSMRNGRTSEMNRGLALATWTRACFLLAGAGTASGVVLVPSQGAEAAVRVCKPAVVSALSSGQTELLAKQGALKSWTEKAKAYGPQFTSWRVATQKQLKCVKGKDGGFECVAFASPCMVQQNPRNPEGPLKRPKRNRSAPIEV